MPAPPRRCADPPHRDVDLFVDEEDVAWALRLLESTGFRPALVDSERELEALGPRVVLCRRLGRPAS